MEASESPHANFGSRRLRRLVKKHVVIDSEDEVEEVEYPRCEISSRALPLGLARREDEGASCRGMGRVTKSEVDEKEGIGLVGIASNPISSWQSFGKDITEKVKDLSLEDTEDASRAVGHLGNSDDESGSFALGVDAISQENDVGELSSSSSGSELGDDGSMDDIVEEPQEEIVTTLSSEDAALLASVMKVIEEGGDLKKLKVESLKTYLRHHRLRMGGVKVVLLSRIEEHLKIKDGQAEGMYPRSSFSINCKGDVCLGDTVLFLQNVYELPFDFQRRCAAGPSVGQRWVAGKVVNESYGAKKQQHTFTIEVLWSTGTQPFLVMRPLQIKGRNLYRIRTLRQPWLDEVERKKVVDEKHARGGEARALRHAVKSLKLKRKIKLKKDAGVHPYSRSNTMEPPTKPPPQSSVPYARIHTQDNAHLSRVLAPSAPALATSVPHRTQTELAERRPAPEPRSPRGKISQAQHVHHHEDLATTLGAPEPAEPHRGGNHGLHGQQNLHEGPAEKISAPSLPPGSKSHGKQNHREGMTETITAPLSRGRDFCGQQSRYEGSAQAHHVPSKVPVHDSRHHGRVYTERQVYQGGLASQNREHLNHGRQLGAATLPCSTRGCDHFGAKQCISRSCASCCHSKNGTGRGRCTRHP